MVKEILACGVVKDCGNVRGDEYGNDDAPKFTDGGRTRFASRGDTCFEREPMTSVD